MKAWARWQDWGTVLLGIVIFAAPFVFNVPVSSNVAWTAFGAGILLVLSGLWSEATEEPNVAVEWIPLILGAALFVSPWIVQFTDQQNMAWSAWVIGAIAILNSGAELLFPAQTTSAA